MAEGFKKRYKRVVVTLVLLICTAGLAYLLGWSSALTVKEVKIEGSTEKSTLLAKLNSQSIAPAVGQQLARVNLRSIERVLSQSDWIANVEVSRDWFKGGIKIQIVERSAIARALIEQNKIVNFDAQGALFTPTSDNQKKYQDQLPLISSANNSKTDLANVALLLRQMPADLAYLIENLDQISITSSGLILMNTAIDTRPLRINWGMIDQIDQKFEVLAALLELPENKDISQVDLSQPNAPIVK